MAENYSWSLLRVAVAQICQQLGWNSIHATPLELLTDVLERYLLQVARVTQRYAEQFGTSDPQLEDLALAFRHLGIEISELEEYMSHIDSTPFAHEVLAYPAPKENNLQIPKPNSRELQQREDHIPDYLPLLYQEAVGNQGDLEESMVTCEASTVLPTPERNTQECGTSSDVSSIPGEKRPLPSPSDGMHFKRQRITYHPELPSIAGHSQYEMRSVTMAHNGILTPTRQGKLPDAKTPPPGHKDLKQESSTAKSSVRMIKLDFDNPDEKEKMFPQEKVGKDKTNNSVTCLTVHKDKTEKNIKSKSSGKKKLDKKSLECLKTVKVHKLPKSGRVKSPAKSAKVTVIRKEGSLKDLLSKDTKFAEQDKQRADVQTEKDPVSINVDISSIQNSPIDLSMKTLNKINVSGTEDGEIIEKDKRKIEGEKHFYFIKEKIKAKRYREKEKVKEKEKGKDKENFTDQLEDSLSENRLVIAENVKGKLKDSEERVKARLAAIDDTIGSVIYQSLVNESDSGKHTEAGEWQAIMKSKNTQEMEDPVTTNASVSFLTNDKIKKEKEPLTLSTCAPDSIAASIDAVIQGLGSDNEARDAVKSEPFLSPGTSTVMSPTLSSPLSPSKRGRKRGRGRSKGRGRGSPGCSGSPRGRGSPWGRGSPGAAVEDPIKASLEKQRSEELSVYDFPDSPEEGELLPHSHGVPVKIFETQPKFPELPCGQSLTGRPPTGAMSPPTQDKIQVVREKIKVEPCGQQENNTDGQEKEKGKERTRTKDKEKRKERKKKKKKDKDKEKDRKEKHKEVKKHKDVLDSPHPSFPILKIRFGSSPSTPGHYSITSETKMSPHPESSPSQRCDTSIPKIVIKALPPPPDKDREHKIQDMGNTKEEFHKEAAPVPSSNKASKSSKKRDKDELKKERREREERKAQEREAQLEFEAKEKEAKDRLELLEREAKERAALQEREAKEKAQLEQEAKERVERENAEKLEKEAELDRKSKELERKLEEKKLQLEREEKIKEEKVDQLEEIDTSQDSSKKNRSSLDDEEETIPAQDGVFDNLTDDLEQAEKNQAEEQDIGSPEIGRKSSTELEFFENSSLFVPLIPPQVPPPLSQTKKATKPRRQYKRRRSPRGSNRKMPKMTSSPAKKSTDQSGDNTPLSIMEDQPVTPDMPSTLQSPSPNRMTPSPPQRNISNISSVSSPHRSPPRITPSPPLSKPQDSEEPPKSPSPSSSGLAVTGEERKSAARGQVIPPIPPPSIQPKGKSKQCTVFVETVGSYLNASGEKIWICPACKMPDDGSPMIGCDVCDDWYHWICVNIKVEPASEDQWFCSKCVQPSAKKQPKKRGRKKKKP